jgi:ATP citrate (pro-S)-lyase
MESCDRFDNPDSLLPGWIFNGKVIVKPDQLIERRGKASWLALTKDWNQVRDWIAARVGKPQKVWPS